MPQQSSITFSAGQQAQDDASGATAAKSAVEPLYGFRAVALGASQASPATGTFTSFSRAATETTPVGSTVSKLPTSAVLPPRLKIASPGSAPRLITRQLFEGTVTEVRDTGFLANLVDKTNHSNPEEHAVFDFSEIEISPEDRPLIRTGASFYWVIGIEITVAGQVKNVSMVQFRRLPKWTRSRLARGSENARRLAESLREQP